MGEPIEQRRGHLGVGEDLRPLGEGEVGRDDQRGAFIEPTDQMEEQLATRLGERQIAELVQDDKVHAGQLIGESTGPSGLALGLKLVNEVHHVEEARFGTLPDAGAGDPDGPGPVATAGRSGARHRSCLHTLRHGAGPTSASASAAPAATD